VIIYIKARIRFCLEKLQNREEIDDWLRGFYWANLYKRELEGFSFVTKRVKGKRLLKKKIKPWKT